MESITPPTFSPPPRWLTSRRFIDLAPVGLVGLGGALTIMFYAAQGPRSAHIDWLVLALVENVIALLFLRRHPAGVLAGILATFLLLDYPATMALPVAIALLAVTTAASRRMALIATAATAIVATAAPLLHRDSSIPARVGVGLVAVALTAALGRSLRERHGQVTDTRSEVVTAPAQGAVAEPLRDADVVEAEALTKRFGDATVVSNVDLHVPRGTAFGYLGPNGAGKTTLIRMLLGLTKPTAGSMKLLGLELPNGRRRALARVGAIVDEPRFHRHLSGRQNLWALAAAREPETHGRIDGALERVGLAERADDRVATYSMGMRQRLGIAACLIADPELLILDEPMNGLDPAGMLELRELIRSLVAEGRTVVLSSHLLDEVEKTCDQVAIVDRGRVVLQGGVADLTADSATQLRLECSDPSGAALLLRLRADVVDVRAESEALIVELATADARETTAQIARVLLDAGFALYQLRLERASLEQQFLEITTRLGEAA